MGRAARRNLSLEQIDRDTLIHPLTHLKDHAAGRSAGPRIFEQGQGVRLTDRDGRQFIDAFAGLYCVNVGYGRTEIADAIHEQALKLAYYHAYAASATAPAILLSERILELAPPAMSRIFFGMSGSDANETLVKIAWYYNNVRGREKKKKIISRQRGYHGATIIAGSLTGLASYHRAFDLPVGPILHTLAPHHYWEAAPGMSEREFSRYCAERLDALIEAEGPETVAAFIGEPVLGTGGIVPPPEGYWQEIQAVLARHDVLLIADEVICGFGRLGAPFGSFLYDIEPDLMSIAKGVTSAYLPLSGALVNDKVWSVMEEGAEKFGPFAHGFTYSAHALGAAAAMANLDIIEREDLTGNARATGGYLIERLHGAFDSHPLVGEVRGVGLMAALEFVADRVQKVPFAPRHQVSQRISAACLDEGLIARAMPHGAALGFAPPLVIGRDDVDEIVDITRRAVDKVSDELTAGGEWKAA